MEGFKAESCCTLGTLEALSGSLGFQAERSQTGLGMRSGGRTPASSAAAAAFGAKALLRSITFTTPGSAVLQ